MAETRQHAEHGAGDAVVAFDGLVRVRCRPEGDRLRHVALHRELPLQQLGRVRLVEQLRLEIDARRKAHIGMVGPGEAVDATMLAAAIGIDRAIERQVRRSIPCQDAACALGKIFRRQAPDRVIRSPAVVERLALRRLVATAGVGRRPTSLACACGEGASREPPSGDGEWVVAFAATIPSPLGPRCEFRPRPGP